MGLVDGLVWTVWYEDGSGDVRVWCRVCYGPMAEAIASRLRGELVRGWAFVQGPA